MSSVYNTHIIIHIFVEGLFVRYLRNRSPDIATRQFSYRAYIIKLLAVILLAHEMSFD